jgi:hypothetical protein
MKRGAIKIPPKIMIMHGDSLDKTFKDRNVLNVALGQLTQPQPEVVGATTRSRSRSIVVHVAVQDHYHIVHSKHFQLTGNQPKED